MFNLFVVTISKDADEETRDKIDDALEPPNRINPGTGLPYGWDEDTELDDLDSQLTR